MSKLKVPKALKFERVHIKLTSQIFLQIWQSWSLISNKELQLQLPIKYLKKHLSFAIYMSGLRYRLPMDEGHAHL